MEYDSVEDLEYTIDRVQSRIVRLDRELETVLEETRNFLENNHIYDDLRSASRYVDAHMPQKTMPAMAKMYASQQLENPEEADNWDGLEEDEIADELEGEPNLEHFLESWEERPHRIFTDIDSYDDKYEFEVISGLHNPGMTMARLTGEATTAKQQDDLDRGRVLEWEFRDRKIPEYGKHEDFWRERLYWNPDFSRWVNREKLESDRSI